MSGGESEPGQTVTPSQFFSHQKQGFVRTAACTPRVHVGDPQANLAETLALAREGDAEGCDLMVFPELGISAYAIDDLFGQDALLDRVDAAIGDLAGASAKLRPALVVSAATFAGTAGSITAPSWSTAAACSASFRKPSCRTIASTTRSAGSPRPWAWAAASMCASPDARRPFGTDLVFAASDLSDFVFHVEILRRLLGAHAAVDPRRPRWRSDPLQSVGLERRHRQGGGARRAVRGPFDPRLCGLCVRSLRPR